MNFHVIQVGSPLKFSSWATLNLQRSITTKSRNASETAVQFTARTQKLTTACLQDRDLRGDAPRQKPRSSTIGGKRYRGNCFNC